jgi:N-sulfoglucosamine sulfohydrolase
MIQSPSSLLSQIRRHLPFNPEGRPDASHLPMDTTREPVGRRDAMLFSAAVGWSLVISATTLGLAPNVWAEAPVQEVEKPNLLLIIADDLGRQLNSYGDETVPTPNFDRLAREGVQFNRGYVTAASCSPSRGSIMTGLYPHQHGMIGLSHQDWSTRFGHRIHDGTPLLPNVLKDMGYRTASFGKTHFEPKAAFAWDKLVENHDHLVERDVVLMAEEAGNFARESGDQPFFIVASYVDPHRYGDVFTPFQRKGLPENPIAAGELAPFPYLGLDSRGMREDVAGYYNMVKRLDYGLGLLLDRLDSEGVLDNTLVLFVSDNGPDFIRMKKSVYEEGVRVPFFVRWPGKAEAGLVREDLVSTIDIFPTFVSAARGTLEAHGAGHPLQPLLQSGDVPWRDSIMTEFIVHAPSQYFPSYALSTERYQLIHNLDSGRRNPITIETRFPEWRAALSSANADHPFTAAYRRYDAPPEFELYDLEKDPFFLHNLAGDAAMAEVLEDLKKRLHQWRVETEDPLLDPAYRKKLTERYRETTPFIPVDPQP